MVSTLAWPRLNAETNRRALLTVDVNLGEIRRRHYVDLITLQVTASDRQGLNRLIHSAGAYRLDLGNTMLPHYSGDSARNRGGPRTR